MAAVLRSGILGTGFMGEVHARAVRAAGGVVSAVGSRTLESAESAADRFAAGRGVVSPEELVSSDDVDIVHICTPNSSHLRLAQLALAAGKHVICEKPIATSVADARLLTDTAAQAGVVNAVPFVYRFYSSVREIRARVQGGDAGAIRLVHGSYLQDWLSRPGDHNWRVDPSLGGASRAFGDIGVHWCDLVEFVTGHRITRLAAKLLVVPRDGVNAGGADTEDAATMIFRTDQGAAGSVVISQVSPGRKNRLWLSVDAADRSYEFNHELPDSLWIGGRDQNVVLPRAAEASVGPPIYNLVPTGHPQGYQDSFTAFVVDVYRAVRGENVDGLPTFSDGLRAAEITDAVLGSAGHDSWVEVAT